MNGNARNTMRFRCELGNREKEKEKERERERERDFTVSERVADRV